MRAGNNTHLRVAGNPSMLWTDVANETFAAPFSFTWMPMGGGLVRLRKGAHVQKLVVRYFVYEIWKKCELERILSIHVIFDEADRNQFRRGHSLPDRTTPYRAWGSTEVGALCDKWACSYGIGCVWRIEKSPFNQYQQYGSLALNKPVARRRWCYYDWPRTDGGEKYSIAEMGVMIGRGLMEEKSAASPRWVQ